MKSITLKYGPPLAAPLLDIGSPTETAWMDSIVNVCQNSSPFPYKLLGMGEDAVERYTVVFPLSILRDTSRPTFLAAGITIDFGTPRQRDG